MFALAIKIMPHRFQQTMVSKCGCVSSSLTNTVDSGNNNRGIVLIPEHVITYSYKCLAEMCVTSPETMLPVVIKK